MIISNTENLKLVNKIFLKKSLPKWRAFTLLFIHLLFAIHFFHWKIKGRTLAPLEFSESLHTIHDGVLTAGFIFTIAMILGTIIFGRFFCGWGCHILALQDMCSWLLAKFGIKAKPVRSRTMVWIPLGILLYLYVWPQLHRIITNQTQPPFTIQSDADGWASYITTDLMRAMPGLFFTLLTFLVCGFSIVYFLGSRSFCYSVCPYGVFFGWADKFSSGAKLVLVGGCENCGLCTLNCKSGVKVIQEIKQFGMVVDSNCLKSLDCVAGCPNDAIGLAFKTPTIFTKKEKTSVKKLIEKKKVYDFTFREEIYFLIFFFLLFITYRGLYEIGILLAGGIGVIGAVGIIKMFRWVKARGTAKPNKYVFWAMLLFFGLTLHSAFIHYHTYQGNSLYRSNENSIECAKHLQFVYDWSLFHNPQIEKELAYSYAASGDFSQAESFFEKHLQLNPEDIEAIVRFGNMLNASGQKYKANQEYFSTLIPDEGLKLHTDKAWRATAHSFIAQNFAAQGDMTQALEHLSQAVKDNPDDVSHYCNFGSLYIKLNDLDHAREILLQGKNKLGTVDCLEGLLQVARQQQAH